MADAALSTGILYMGERKMMEIFPDSWMKLWSEWEMRILVLISLCMQIMLICLGKRRKHDHRRRIRYTLWLAYLCADSVANMSLGVLSNNQDETTLDAGRVLKAMWAPVLLLHLGGPDTITAYSMEDNELWLRHLLGLVLQTGVAAYVFLKSVKPTELNYVAIPIFVSGIIKYGERTWALRSASNMHFRNALLPRPDPGPNYAKFMEQYHLRESEGYRLKWDKLKDPKVVVPSLDSIANGRTTRSDTARRDSVSGAATDPTIIKTAYASFETYKRLFADLILSFQEVEKSKSFFLRTGWERAFNVIQVELALVFDVLHTKSSLLSTRFGRVLRAITLVTTSLTLATFYTTKKNGAHQIDVIITYLLLLGAVALEVLSTLVWLFSDWAIIWLDDQQGKPMKKHLDRAISWYLCNKSKRKFWSNLMAQHSLIAHCIEQKPTKSLISLPCYLYYKLKGKIKSPPALSVPDDLKQYIYEQLYYYSSISNEGREFCTYRGAWTLEDYEYQDVCWSIEQEFDHSILLWHIATELCYCIDEEAHVPDLAKCSRLLSNYMLYLLVKQPLMLPNGIGQIRYQDTCAEAKDFVEERSIQDVKKACQRLSNIKTKIRPSDFKGDRSKSVLFDACRLAKQLQKKEAYKWDVIAGVWVEMLAYAANKCRSNYHAQRLSHGGELLTHIWLLLAQLGLSEHVQISEGHFRVVLDVS